MKIIGGICSIFKQDFKIVKKKSFPPKRGNKATMAEGFNE